MALVVRGEDKHITHSVTRDLPPEQWPLFSINGVHCDVSPDAVRLHVMGGPVQPVMAVREQIHQVLLNVVLNAKQAIGEKGDISVAIEQSNGSVVVTVDDTGSGIPSSMLGSLFRPLQSSRPGGLGIGLYQCKQIVEAHQGTIQMRSEKGKGTQVRIELPIHSPPVTIDEDSIIQSNR